MIWFLQKQEIRLEERSDGFLGAKISSNPIPLVALKGQQNCHASHIFFVSYLLS